MALFLFFVVHFNNQLYNQNFFKYSQIVTCDELQSILWEWK